MINNVLPILILLMLLVLALWLMRRGWVRSKSRTATIIPTLPLTPESFSANLGPFEATYISTTSTGRPLERISAHTLGDLSPADVSLGDQGMLISRDTAEDIFIENASMRGVGLSRGIAGKAMGSRDILVVSWQAPDTDTTVDTGVLFRHPEQRDELIASLTQTEQSAP